MNTLSEDILNALLEKTGYKKISFRYEIISNKNVFLSEPTVKSCNVSYNTLAEIKRKASIVMLENHKINYNSDRLRAFFVLYYTDSRTKEEKTHEWTLGTFIMSSPTQSEEKGEIISSVECYDYGYILQKGSLTEPFIIEKNQVFTNALQNLLSQLGFINFDIEASELSANRDIFYPVGTSYAQIVSDILSNINYGSLFFDVYGVPKTSAYIPPASREVDFAYKTDKYSIINHGATLIKDTFSIPNVFISTSTNTESEEILTSVFVNDSANSPVSTVTRGYAVVMNYEYQDITNQDVLDSRNRRNAEQYSSIYEKMEFETALMPFHSDSNTLFLEHKDFSITGKYSETSWSMDLKADGRMKHGVRKAAELT